MNDYTLADIFDAVYEQEFSEFDNPPRHLFSRRHRKAMKEILYPQTISTSAANLKIPLKKRVIIALLVILLSALGITAGAAVIKRFILEEHSDHTELLAVNDKNAPIMIDRLYYPTAVPDGYALYDHFNNSRNVFIRYVNIATEREIFFDQCVKDAFSVCFDHEYSSVEETEIDEKPALYLYNNKTGAIVWDNGDYIMEVGGHFSKDELMAFAKSVEIGRE